MGKMAKKNDSKLAFKLPTVAEVRRNRKKLKFRKATKAEIGKHLAEYESILREMRKLGLPPLDAVAAVREQREKN